MDKTRHVVILVRNDGRAETTEITGYAGESTADQMLFDAKDNVRYVFGMHTELYEDSSISHRQSFFKEPYDQDFGGSE